MTVTSSSKRAERSTFRSNLLTELKIPAMNCWCSSKSSAAAISARTISFAYRMILGGSTSQYHPRERTGQSRRRPLSHLLTQVVLTPIAALLLRDLILPKLLHDSRELALFSGRR